MKSNPYTGTSPGLRKTLLFALAFGLSASAHAVTTVVNFSSGSQAVMNTTTGSAVPSGLLTGGGVNDGDGAVIQLGYYDQATVGNNFAGVWHALTGQGSLNTGGDYGGSPSPTTFNMTSIGDVGGGGPPGNSGIFAISVEFDSTKAGTFNDLPVSTGTPLAMRFYNNTTLGNSDRYNVVSNDAWTWKLPALGSPLPPTIEMSLDDLGLEWQSIASGQLASTAFTTSLAIVAIPEPSRGILALVGMGLAFLRRRRS